MKYLKYKLLVVYKDGVARESDLNFPTINNAWQYCDNTDILKSAYVKMVCLDEKVVSSSYPFEYLIGKDVIIAISLVRKKNKNNTGGK